jgi:DNA-directed RNA polymerase specialized sigma24 family protein
VPGQHPAARYYPAQNEHKRRAREAGRRRQAVTMLQIAECTCRYAASRLSNGAEPEEARQTALFVAGELAEVADALRRAVRLRAEDRPVVARQLARLGWPTKQIAAQVGVTPRSVRYYVNGRGSA